MSMSNKVEVKICGNQSLQDVQNVVELGFDYVGFVFAKSKRRVHPSEVKKWIKNIPEEIQTVGVFVNPTLEDLQNFLEEVPLDIVQLHGKETPSFVQEVVQNLPQRVWKALHYHEHILEEMERFKDVDGFVIDSSVKGQFGGTGKTFNWDNVREYQAFADEKQKKLFIAGGINPENVHDLLQKEISGIDLASGVEVNSQKNKSLLRLLKERVEKTHVS